MRFQSIAQFFLERKKWLSDARGALRDLFDVSKNHVATSETSMSTAEHETSDALAALLNPTGGNVRVCARQAESLAVIGDFIVWCGVQYHVLPEHKPKRCPFGESKNNRTANRWQVI